MNDSMIKKLLITQAISSKRNKLNKGFITNGTIWDKLVLKKIQNLLGGRIHTWVSHQFISWSYDMAHISYRPYDMGDIRWIVLEVRC